MAPLSISKLAQLARIVAVGSVRNKSAVYELISAVRKLDAKLPASLPLMIHLEDFIASAQYGGEYELLNELKRVASQRELFAHVEDYCIGTCGLVALLCAQQRTCNQTGTIGGFGDCRILIDSSGAAAKDGRTVLVVKAGQHKGAGTPGSVLTPEQVAVLSQPTLDATQLLFKELTAVAKWNQTQAAEILTGKVFAGDDRKRLKLVSHVMSADEAFYNFTKAIGEKYVR